MFLGPRLFQHSHRADLAVHLHLDLVVTEESSNSLNLRLDYSYLSAFAEEISRYVSSDLLNFCIIGINGLERSSR